MEETQDVLLLILATFSVASICNAICESQNRQGGRVRPGAPGSAAPDYLLSEKTLHTISAKPYYAIPNQTIPKPLLSKP